MEFELKTVGGSVAHVRKAGEEGSTFEGSRVGVMLPSPVTSPIVLSGSSS